MPTWTSLTGMEATRVLAALRSIARISGARGQQIGFLRRPSGKRRTMSLDVSEIGSVPASWTHRHLLGLEDLSAEEIALILDSAVMFKDATGGCRQKLTPLQGKTCANLFFEPSTRTKTSFALAARRLGADTVDFSSSGSSLSKGETFIDTARNIEAMGVDVVVVRHRTPGTPYLLAQNLHCSV